MAVGAADAYYLLRNYSYYPEDYDEDTDKIRLAAHELTDQDVKILAKIWRAALAASASIDPEDRRPVGHKVDLGDYHHFYRILSSMIETVLEEKRGAEFKEKSLAELKERIAQRQLRDLSNEDSVPL